MPLLLADILALGARGIGPGLVRSAGIDRAGAAVGADRDIGELPFRHLHEIVGIVGAADHPGLDADAQRAVADAVDIGIAGQYVADLDRLVEHHRIDRDRRHPAARPLLRHHAAGKVHLRHQPAAEDVARRVGVGRHGHGPQHQFAARLFGSSLH